MTDDTWYITKVGPECPAGPGWQQVPPPVPGDQSQCVTVLQCYVSIKQTASQHRHSRYELPPLDSWSTAMIELSQDIKFNYGHNDSPKQSIDARLS